jgi:hypothetical protein
MNKLYFGDNLTVLREHIQPESVDLEGLKQLQTMLQKYAEILEMMTPKKDEASN